MWPGPQPIRFCATAATASTLTRVAQIGRAAADGLLEGGVLPVLKHIPGHGRATVDSHLDLPRVDAELEELSGHAILPRSARLNDLPMGMTAHLVYDAHRRCACDDFAQIMMRLIREDIGFDGLIMTDDISMKALQGSLTRACARGACGGLRCDPALQRHAGRTRRGGRSRGADDRGRPDPRRGARWPRARPLMRLTFRPSRPSLGAC